MPNSAVIAPLLALRAVTFNWELVPRLMSEKKLQVNLESNCREFWLL